MKKSNIIIIGSDSYIARGLEKYLNNCNVQQYSFYNWMDNLEKLKDADCIINFSISPDFSTSTVDIDNVIDVQIAKQIKDSNAHFIYISSRKVYGTFDNIKKHNENDDLFGHDYYSINKIKTEKKLQEILNDKLTILRVSNIIGEPVNRKGYKTFIGWISEEYIKNNLLIVNQNEESLKDFITKEFLHENIAYFLKNRISGIYNVSAGFGTSIRDILVGYVGNKVVFKASEEEKKDQFIIENNKLLGVTGITITRADIDKCLHKYHKKLKKLRFDFIFTKYKNKLFNIVNETSSSGINRKKITLFGIIIKFKTKKQINNHNTELEKYLQLLNDNKRDKFINSYKEQELNKEKHKNLLFNESYFPRTFEYSEIHLIILWQNARFKEKDILDDIKKNLEIIEVYDVTWNKDKVANNFTRFYGEKLDDGSFKEKECGTGSFLLVVVKDNIPKYEYVETSRGFEYVNINLFNLKTKYRSWTNGGHKIHTTNSPKETNHDIALLLGINYDDYIQKYNNTPWDNQIKYLNQDLAGANGWNNFQELFYVLNATTEYLVLRGFEIIDKENIDVIDDIDILTNDYQNITFILNGDPQINTFRPHFYTKIANKYFYIDVWNINNNYYDKNWANDFFKKKIKHNNYYILDNINRFYELIYHCLIHKNNIKDEYYHKAYESFKEISLDEKYELANYKYPFDLYYEILLDFINKKSYSFVKPIDSTVLYNEKVIELKDKIDYLENKYLISDIKPYMVNQYNGGGSGYCYYVGYLQNKKKVFIKYGGIGKSAYNEFKTLQALYVNNQYNFLKPYYFDNNINNKCIITEFIEGISLSDYLKIKKPNIETIEMFTKQIENIARSLLETKIMHRDIRPANIIVTKDLRLILIDTQFAISFDNYQELECILNDQPLFQNLGEDYSMGKYIWDDMHSLSKICKLIGRDSQYIDQKINSFTIKMNV